MLSGCSDVAASAAVRHASASDDSSSIVLDGSANALGVGGELGPLLETSAGPEAGAPACHLLQAGSVCRAVMVGSICLDKLKERRK